MSSGLVKNKDVITQRVNDETVLFDMSSGNYYSLNELGSRAWELVDGTASLHDVAVTLASEYDAPPEIIEQDLQELFKQLLSDGLLVDSKGENGIAR